eukprot:7447327-Pyramimonas_sp.AAC.1
MSAPTSSRVLAGCCASDEPVIPTGPHHPPRSNVGSRPARPAPRRTRKNAGGHPNKHSNQHE